MPSTVDLLGVSTATLAILFFIALYIAKLIYPIIAKNTKEEQRAINEKIDTLLVSIDELIKEMKEVTLNGATLNIRVEVLEREIKEIKREMKEEGRGENGI